MQDASVGNLIRILQTCRQTKNLIEANKLHAYIYEHELESHILLGNYLVSMLVNCNNLPDAQHVFDRLPQRNEHCWTVLIKGYSESREPNHAFHLYLKMQEEGLVQPNMYTYLALLNASTKLKDVESGQKMHAEITERGLERYMFTGCAVVGNTLIDMYGKCGSVAEAQHVFDMLPIRSVVSWAIMIAGYAERGLIEEAANCFQAMQLEGTSPDSVTMVFALKACCRTGALENGRQMHIETIKRGMETELHVSSTLIDMYSKCGSFSEALQVFVTLPVQSAVTWNILLAGSTAHGHAEEVLSCFKEMELQGLSPTRVTFFCGLKACISIGAMETGQQIHVEAVKRGWERERFIGSTLMEMYNQRDLHVEAHKVFDKLQVRDAATWNALIAGYIESGCGEAAVDCFQQMQLAGTSPDSITLVCGLKACGMIGALKIGWEIHTEIMKRGLETETHVGNTLIDVYGRCGSIEGGQDVFEKLPVRTVVSWNAMIKAYGDNHKGNMAVKCFENMQDKDVKPNSITFTCLLAACSHASMVLEGQMYFKLMRERHKMEPTSDHFACMIDLFARSGDIYAAERFVSAMEFPPPSAVMTALLSACKMYVEVDMCQKCFQQLVEENQEDASSYLLIVDVYTNAGKWRDANRVREMRKDAKKKPHGAYV